jgi:uncharacterized protein
MTLWISLKDLPAEGQDFTFTDQSLWTEPMQDFGVAGTIGTPLEANLYIVPQDEGFLVTGSMRGSVIIPCDSCVEDYEAAIEATFDSFEELTPADDVYADECRLRMVHKAPEFDAGGYLWEQFMLALPLRPVCSPGCKGLCPQCGANRNLGQCDCGKEEGDPRLAVLRKLKLS